MSQPATIRTKFASAEDAARVYGVPFQRVEELRRLLDKVKHQVTQQKSGKVRGKARSKSPSKARPAGTRKSGARRSARRAA